MILFGADESVARWVSEGVTGRNDIFKEYAAIGILRNGQLVAGVVYHNYHTSLDERPLFIEMSVYSVDKRWCSRHNLKIIFSYPFAQLRLERVQATCAAENRGVQSFLERLGFSKEGYHPKAHLDGSDAVSYGMLKQDCKWL